MTQKAFYLKSFEGGSHSITILMEDSRGRFIRKMAPRGASKTLRFQASWLQQFEKTRRFPRVLGTFESNGNFNLDLEYLDSPVPFRRFIEENSVEASWNRLVSILKFVEKQVHCKKQPVANLASLQKYFREKVFLKLEECATILPNQIELLGRSNFEINGRGCVNIRTALEYLQHQPWLRRAFENRPQHTIHGDLTVENLLADENKFYLLDPNDGNTVSDRLVEMGKVFQSLHSNYEYFENTKIRSRTGNRVEVEWAVDRKYSALFKKLIEKMTGESNISILLTYLHEAIHFTRLLPYKARKAPNLFEAYFVRTVWLFNQLIYEANNLKGIE